MHATTWVNLENTVPNKPDTKCHMSYNFIYIKYPE